MTLVPRPRRRSLRVPVEPSTVEELIDELCEGIASGRAVVLDEEQVLRFAWWCAATGWEWMRA